MIVLSSDSDGNATWGNKSMSISLLADRPILGVKHFRY